jgi:CheY-like chemotaxis protein
MDRAILCIDDNQLLLRLYKKMLEEHGYESILASNGWEGLELLKSRPVDCVILDYHMPGMDGSAVIRRMRCRQDLQPVILVSTSHPPPEILEKVGAFVEKGANLFSELLECVESVIAEGRKRPSEPALRQLTN